MKLRACAAGAFIVIVGTLEACSSTPSQPPIDTSGSTAGGQSGGSSAATPASEDAATAFGAPDDAAVNEAGTSCLTTCQGCCTTANVCLGGEANTGCGINGLTCQTCLGGTQCSGGQCE